MSVEPFELKVVKVCDICATDEPTIKVTEEMYWIRPTELMPQPQWVCQWCYNAQAL